MQIDVDFQEDLQNVFDVNYVVENFSLDLEQYVVSYSGLMCIEWLQFIVDYCFMLWVEVLKMVFFFVQRIFNVDMYEEIYCKFLEVIRELQNVFDVIFESGVEFLVLDMVWVEVMWKKVLLKLEKLDIDLKNYKGNFIKESIWCGYDDLGDYYLDCGDFSNVFKCYFWVWDYCISVKYVINMCFNVIKVSVYLQNWFYVFSYVSKVEFILEIVEQ